ncbi:other wee protein kinase [Moniliophthora roreri]|nr:other wee protein kinase [Moniliophthora roreri]
MLASPPLHSFYSRQRESSISPSCRSQSSRSPLPDHSPLRQQRPLLQPRFPQNPQSRSDTAFLQSPFRSPLLAEPSWTPRVADDDDEKYVFLDSPTASCSPLFPVGTSPSLLTPIKRASGAVDELNQSAIIDTPSSTRHIAHPGGGVKRKPYRQSTPLRKHSLTPLDIASDRREGSAFDRLAPLPAPSFNASTPSKTVSSQHIRRQTASMTRLRITDLNGSDEDFSTANDSGLDLGEDDCADALFLSGGSPQKGGIATFRKALRLKGRSINKSSDEVAEAISPGGHIIKRRARARPLSDELLESIRVPSPSKKPNAVKFPSAQPGTNSPNSSPEVGSPMLRHRTSGLHAPRPQPPQPPKQRIPFTRVDSATLFFGPPVQSSPAVPPRRTRVSTSVSSPNATDPSSQPTSYRPKMMNRHSYCGSGSLPLWGMQSRADTPSPQSSPPKVLDRDCFLTDEGDSMMIDDDIPANSSFTFSVTESTPSPRRQSTISKKYKARDSGIVLSDDDFDMDAAADRSFNSEFLNSMPQASTSVSSLYSDGEDGLITPGAGPRTSSGWPEAVIVAGGDEPISFSSTSQNGPDIDAFILRTLAAAAKAPQEEKKAPGTPVKKTKISYLSGARPWQSAITHKVGLEHREKKGKAPRKSLPAVFPSVGRKASKSFLDSLTDSEDDSDESPSSRKERYAGLGLGRPRFPVQTGKGGLASRPRWLTRRSSSGAFSSGSDLSTPTRSHDQGSGFPVQYSPSKNRMKLSPARSASGSSNSSVTTLNSPTTALRTLPIAGGRPYHQANGANWLVAPSKQARQSRYERDFIEVAEVGSGEFGKVIKAKMRNSDNGECYAIKKSKQFEGTRHRLRLREEVDILQHLSCKNGGRRHPNVLAFVDSWEEAEYLYICTELCELGNFARFLWEYGRVFPRLDEARVWKIIADLSNGLRFIHDSGVIHLDLKPANIFVTGEGRFKIGDFGMASLWPRPRTASTTADGGSFEREGDKLYLAPEVLQGMYGKAADVFSFGMTILETASNIVVPDQGEAWHSLRREDFSQVDLGESPELLRLIRGMMRTDPSLRLKIEDVYAHPVVSRTRLKMEQMYDMAIKNGSSLFAASPLASSNFYPPRPSPPQYPIPNSILDPMDPVDFRAFYPYTPNEVKHRKRTTSAQLKVLESIFKHDTKPNAALRNELAAQLDMTARGVQVWFQNRRAKEKTKASKAAAGQSTSASHDTASKDVAVAASQRPENVTEPSSFPRDLPELSTTETSSQESSPAGASPPHLHLVTDSSHASWQSSPIATPDDFRHSGDFSDVYLIRRGSLPADAFPVPDDCQQGPPLVGHLDPFTRRRSVDASLHRLAQNPYAGLARAKTSGFAGPRISGHLHDYPSSRISHQPGAVSAVHLSQHGTFHTRHSSMEARPYRFSPGAVSSSSSPSPLSPYHTIRSSLPDNSLFAFSSRPIASPIPGPLPSPDFSFGAPVGYSRSESDRSSPDSSNGFLFRGEDLDTEDEATSYDGFSRFGSIASVANSDSSNTSAYYSEVGSCVSEHDLSSDANLQSRRTSCTPGQFLGLMSGLNVGCEGSPPNGLYEQNHNDGTGTYPSPSSTISAGGSPPLTNGVSSANVAGSSSTDLPYTLQTNHDQLGVNGHSASPVVDAEVPFYSQNDSAYVPGQTSQYGGSEYPSYVPIDNQENVNHTYEHASEHYSAEANFSGGVVEYPRQDPYCVNPTGVAMSNFLQVN